MSPTKRSSNNQSSSRSQKRSTSKRSPSKRGTRRWVARVKTVSTFPPKGLFTKDAPTIAKSLASKKVSPKGPGSGMRMLTYFINRAGRGLSPSRRRVLERAKRILTQRMERQKRHERPRAD
jgi:tRNA(adenine34) deaminase